jgi:hypothetical protein
VAASAASKKYQHGANAALAAARDSIISIISQRGIKINVAAACAANNAHQRAPVAAAGVASGDTAPRAARYRA